MDKSCVIIGGGMGGLFTGALLAKNGVKVTVLEKNHIIGGGLQSFKRADKLYETGIHIMGGFFEGGNMKKICKYLGIMDQINLYHIDSECMDEIFFAQTKDRYKLPSGKENFKKALIQYFPEEKERIKEYIEEIYRLSEELPLFYLKKDNLLQHSERYYWSTNKLISYYIKNEKLQNLLAYLNPLYGGIKDKTPAYIHAIINVLYINGASRFIGGSLQMANALVKVIESNEGEVLNNKDVETIYCENNKILKVTTSDGHEYIGDYYVSSIHPVSLIKRLPQGVLGKLYEKRIEEIPVTYSAFSVFIDLKPNKIKFIEQTCYYHESFNDIWSISKSSHLNWPNKFLFLTPPDNIINEYANRLIIHCLMSYDEVLEWKDSYSGCRPDSYKNWKQNCVEKILKKLEILIPEIKDSINHIYSASPLTVRDYYNSKNGSLYGYLKECDNIYLSQIPVYTKLKNLFLTGQNVGMHGMCGVPLTAILTAETILGKDSILKKINDGE